jgi:hypothetical protein
MLPQRELRCSLLSRGLSVVTDVRAVGEIVSCCHSDRHSNSLQELLEIKVEEDMNHEQRRLSFHSATRSEEKNCDCKSSIPFSVAAHIVMRKADEVIIGTRNFNLLRLIRHAAEQHT